MPLTEKEKLHLVNLARLKMPPEELARLGKDLDSVLLHIEQLAQVDITNVLPMTHAVPSKLMLREDEIWPSMGRETLAGSAGLDGSFVRVPRIVE